MNIRHRSIAIATALVAVLLSLPACASLPVKERTTKGVQATERALGAAQDAERALCDPALAAKHATITVCVASARALGLTDVRHKDASHALAVAFESAAKAAIALQAWHAGDPVPTTLVEVTTQARAALTIVQQLTKDPKVAKLAADVQTALDGAAQLVATLTRK